MSHSSAQDHVGDFFHLVKDGVMIEAMVPAWLPNSLHCLPSAGEARTSIDLIMYDVYGGFFHAAFRNVQ